MEWSFISWDATLTIFHPCGQKNPASSKKQMHFNFQVDDLQSAVEEAVKLGAAKPAQQFGGEKWVTLLDPQGHPFCLCGRKISRTIYPMHSTTYSSCEVVFIDKFGFR